MKGATSEFGCPETRAKTLQRPVPGDALRVVAGGAEKEGCPKRHVGSLIHIIALRLGEGNGRALTSK
jgi:hypothetical protein